MNSLYDTISDTKRKLRNTRIALIALLIFVVVDFFVSLALYSEKSKLEELANVQAQHIDRLYTYLELKDLQISKYKADAAYIKSLGASEKYAQEITKAAGALQVSPKP